jgi:hypothetical protein
MQGAFLGGYAILLRLKVLRPGIFYRAFATVVLPEPSYGYAYGLRGPGILLSGSDRSELISSFRPAAQSRK